MHLKVFLKLKNPKNSLFWTNILINQKNKTKQNTGLVFFLYKKTRVFSNPAHRRVQPAAQLGPGLRGQSRVPGQHHGPCRQGQPPRQHGPAAHCHT
jgi:hypothetical protein